MYDAGLYDPLEEEEDQVRITFFFSFCLRWYKLHSMGHGFCRKQNEVKLCRFDSQTRQYRFFSSCVR
jgi:hypothetical protein